jgi:hypothetical protein
MEPNPSAAEHGGASSTPSDLTAFVERRKRDIGPPRGQRERRRTPSGRRASDAMKMQCPFCSESASAVVRSRGGIVEDKVTRRRECAGCGNRFPTYERLDEEQLERELSGKYGASVVDQVLEASAAIAPTWENAERLLHRLWGQAKDRQYLKREWNDFQQVLAGLRRTA